MSEPSASNSPENAASHIEEPPHTIGATLLKLGPGMIIAGSIVGSGELINTTKAGAEAGFYLLWLILIGCVIKVFAQVEIGRYTVAHSETALAALNRVPGPRWRANWILWFWAATMCTVITQQGGIVGGVGQALTIRFPLTESGRAYNEAQDRWVDQQVKLGELYKQYPALLKTPVKITRILTLRLTAAADPQDADQKKDRDKAQAELDDLLAQRRAVVGPEASAEFEDLETRVTELKNSLPAEPADAYYWATILGVVTAILLFVGHYGLIQSLSTFLVGVFTLLTVVTLVMLQLNPQWAVSGAEIIDGLSFQKPPEIVGSGAKPIFTALAAFGIIGVGSIELITYPYWCLEKGYAKSTGPRDDTPAWDRRAQGWMRVMRFDAWLSMVVYTFATIAFYLLGAAVLWRTGLNPGGGDLIRTLNEMYKPVFGDWAPWIFLFGAFAVLYSTYFVAAAGNSRTVADALGLFGLSEGSERTRMYWTQIISVIWPLLAVALFWIFGWLMGGQKPALMVISAGIGQGILLPMVGIGALWFRYRRCVDALRPGVLWDVMLWLSVIGFVIVGAYTIYSTFFG